MKKKLLLLLGATMILGCLAACGKKDEKKEDNTVAEKTEAQTYEFDTFDGAKVVINDSNIVSQEACDEPLEWADLPADAEQLAPGRDCILFATATNYYVEDVTNKLVTVATREAFSDESGDLKEFNTEKYSLSYNTEYFELFAGENDGEATFSYNHEGDAVAGSNVVMVSVIKNADVMQVVKDYMKNYNASDDEMVENYLGGDDVKGYSYSTVDLEVEGSELKTREAYYAVPCGDDVIVFDVLRTISPDMELENLIDAQVGELLLSLKLN